MEDTVTSHMNKGRVFPFISAWRMGRVIVNNTVALHDLLAFLKVL